MVVQLRLGQYELDNDFIFGTRTPYAVPNDFLVNEFGVEPGEIRSVDSEMPQEDGTQFGVDYRGGMNLVWRINLWKKGQPALDDLAVMERAWKNPNKRLTPGEVTVLRMNKQGRTRLVYGRPRNCSPQYGMVENGWCPIDASFLCIDETFYDDEQSIMEMEMANPPVSGLRMPLRTPMRVSQSQPTFGSFSVGGDKETWPTFLIQGPVINPKVEIYGQYVFELNVALLSHEIISIDPRPWRRLTLLNGEKSRSGRYTSASATPPEMALPPGDYFAAFTGTDITLSSKLTIGWRNAYSTP